MARRPSPMVHQFSRAPQADIPRSSFNRSSGLKTTFNAGYLIPIYVDEALPGDTVQLRTTLMGRLATPIHPIIDNLRVSTFWFAVPYRLVWDNWEKFNGAQDNPADSTDFLVPQLTAPAGGYTEESLEDYFGLPTKVAGYSHSSLWHRAYNLIWNEWFRDQNIQDSVVVDKDDGPDDPADYVLLRRRKRHDYFTSALPWPQKGPAVPLPLGDTAPVIGIGKEDQTYGVNRVAYETGATGTRTYAKGQYIDGTGVGNTGMFVEEDPNNAGFPGIYADLSGATAATINQLRQSWQIQKMYERDARGGTRYTEIIRSHFGVTSPDARLQRPEYLGGSVTPILVSPIAQTSSTDATTPQGNLAAFGTVQGQSGFSAGFTEHCLLIGLASVQADLTYQQGLDRMFSRRTRFDFYWPAFSHIGEQEVLSKEIFLDGGANDDDVFGYQERHAEYRYKPSKVTGKMRSNAAASLDTWHLAQDFSVRPTLSPGFQEDDPPIDRIIAVPTESHLLLDAFFMARFTRPMPTYAVPGLVDHF